MWRIVLAVIIFVIIDGVIKNWQCVEMFPDANRLACILWK